MSCRVEFHHDQSGNLRRAIVQEGKILLNLCRGVKPEQRRAVADAEELPEDVGGAKYLSLRRLQCAVREEWLFEEPLRLILTGDR